MFYLYSTYHILIHPPFSFLIKFDYLESTSKWMFINVAILVGAIYFLVVEVGPTFL